MTTIKMETTADMTKDSISKKEGRKSHQPDQSLMMDFYPLLTLQGLKLRNSSKVRQESHQLEVLLNPSLTLNLKERQLLLICMVVTTQIEATPISKWVKTRHHIESLKYLCPIWLKLTELTLLLTKRHIST